MGRILHREIYSKVFRKFGWQQCHGTTSTTISRVVAEIKSRKVEEGNQQFENECIECSKVQWESNKNKICFQ